VYVSASRELRGRRKREERRKKKKKAGCVAGWEKEKRGRKKKFNGNVSKSGNVSLFETLLTGPENKKKIKKIPMVTFQNVTPLSRRKKDKKN
jgi:hypothetical protein